jgi:hypothetical protein
MSSAAMVPAPSGNWAGPACYARLISAGGALIIVVGSGAMAESDTIAVWAVDDTEHQVLDARSTGCSSVFDRSVDDAWDAKRVTHRRASR